ncbi:protein translocase subunit SecD [Sciscionella sediminilitoris]|uniref:protein translocase subunit SecD n=1 Tax=Sciscionella sediminilitoris TaxID=1445613 RepID=UPI0004DF14EB|nr:protein translocase subunit SecD [Sciscionella sp. SE31]
MAPPAARIRPARYLWTFLAIVVILYGLVFFTGNGKPEPKLGIDLQGGTTVTLTARSPDGKSPQRDQLNQARELIEQRVNGMGIAGTEVVLDGNNIVITAPGQGGDDVKSLGQTAKLNFRPVVGQPVPFTPPPPGKQQQGDQQKPPGNASNSPKPQGRPAPATDAASRAAPNGSGAVDPKVAKEIAEAKATRQSTDPKVQQAAIKALDCSKPDPLVGNDDADKPLVTCNKEHTQKYVLGPTFLDGQQVASTSSGMDQSSGGYSVNLTFKSEGAKKWGDFTSKNVGKQVAVVLDSTVQSDPVIRAATSSSTSITGNFNQEEAKHLAEILKYGSLPLSFHSSNAETISATLGLSSLEAGLIAGGIGLAVVFIYCLIYYRLLGVLTILSLGLSIGLVYAVLVLLGRWMGYSLDLAGVAGVIISIGITADSFVVFFERLKDEVREGRTVRSAVPRAWVRARRTILSADAVSFLAAAVLYILAVGDVKGFAFTLGLSTVLDLVVVFLVTHPLVALASKSKTLTKPSFSGLGAVQKMGATARKQAASGTSAGGAK